MLIYAFIFILSILLIYFGLYFEKKSKGLYYFLTLLGLFIPCFLAGFRDFNVGTDTDGYVRKLFDLAPKSNNLFDYVSMSKSLASVTDLLYILLTYSVSNLLHSFSFFLFLIEFLIIFPIYISLKESCTKKENVIFGLLIFFLFMYNVSFNMVRQSLAISFSILGFHYLNKDNKKLSLLYLLIAIGFHKTALLTLLIYLIYIINKKKEINKYIYLAINIATLIAVLCYKPIILLMYNTGIYKHGLIYLVDYGEFDFSFIDTFTYLLMIVMYIKYFSKKTANYSLKLFIGIESIIVLQLGAFMKYTERFSFYLFYIFLLYIIPNIEFKNVKSNKNYLFYLIIIGYFICYWILVFKFLGMHNTIPYSLF